MAIDRVKPLKYESSTYGSETDDVLTELDPNEDYVAAKGISFENSSVHRIDLVDGQVAFTDPVNGTVRTGDLISISGSLSDILDRQHSDLQGKNSEVNIKHVTDNQLNSLLYSPHVLSSGNPVADKLYVDEKIVASGDMTQEIHESLDTLVHSINEDCFEEIIRDAGYVTNINYWINSEKTTKMRDVSISRSNGFVSQIICKQYNNAGEVIQTLTHDITRSGDNSVQSINWSAV